MKQVTFFTSDPMMHFTFFYSIADTFAKNGIHPTMLLGGPNDLYPEKFPFTRMVLEYMHLNPFKILEPLAHFQMQDHDAPHRELMTAANDMGIPTYHIQHGYIFPDKSGNINLGAGHFDTVANYVCVWSERFADYYEKAGVPRERILITGSPRYDYMPVMKKGEIKNVFFASTSFQNTDGNVELDFDPVECFHKFLDVVKKHPEVTFFIKTHLSPNDKLEYWEQLIVDHGMRDAPNIRLCEPGQNFIECVFRGEVDCLFYLLTTCAIDAVACEIPVIDLRADIDMIEEFERICVGMEPRTDQFEDIIKDGKCGARIFEHVMKINGMETHHEDLL